MTMSLDIKLGYNIGEIFCISVLGSPSSVQLLCISKGGTVNIVFLACCLHVTHFKMSRTSLAGRFFHLAGMERATLSNKTTAVTKNNRARSKSAGEKLI